MTFSPLFSLSAEDGRLILSSNSDIDISARQSLDFVANDIVLKAHSVSREHDRIRFWNILFDRFVFKTNRFTLKNCDFSIVLKVRLLVVVLNHILFASARTVWYSLLLIVDNMRSIVGNNKIFMLYSKQISGSLVSHPFFL